MKYSRSMKWFLLKTAFVFSLLGFFIIYWAASEAYVKAVKRNAIAVSNQLAINTFNSMFQVMSQGWTRTQLETFIRTLESTNSENAHAITIFRGARVIEEYGPIEQPPLDRFNQHTLDQNSAQFDEHDNLLRYSYPLLARQECLICHTNVKPGEALGLIEVRQNLAPLMGHAKDDLLTKLLIMAPFPFLLALLVIYFLNRRINHSVAQLAERIDKVNKVSDLNDLALQQQDLGFTELNQVYGKIETLTERMRTIAVDRELLEFEIRLLEKFIITSEVVRDWREYVSLLLNDINSVMTAFTLFSIFKVDDEVFDLELFWYGPPTDATRRMMEQEIRKALNATVHFRNLQTLKINHNIASSSRPAVDLALEDIRLQTKSLFLEVPKIGGIVGIGVQVGVSQDESRRLVMESILSTLMNVVGSVKAIYKYTKDLEYYATRDPLTDLHNQRVFWEMLNYEVLRAQRHDYHFGLLVIDLDNFKSINDSFGHSFGDRYLQEVARTIRTTLRSGDMLARYGGDEFTVILPETTLEQSREIAERIQVSLRNMASVTPSGEAMDTAISMGVAVYPEHAANAKDLFMFADNMMYKAKGLGKNRVYIPTDEDVIEVFKDISEKSLLISKAIKEKRVIPYFQPMMGSASGAIEAVEVLSRIQLDGDAVMGAHEFIEIAETMGVIHCLDFAVMEKAFEVVNQEGFDGLVFFNMSPRSLVLSEFIPEVKRLTEQAGIEPERVVFEITERDTVKNMTMLERFVGSLKAEGFQLAIDDFGSGFSSFHYLKHFPIDFVKIEGEFVANMVSDHKDNAVVRCIASLAHELSAKTIAEYVESEAVLQAVQSINVTLAQGYHIRRPAPYIFERNRRD